MGMMSLDLFKRLIDQAEGNCEAVTLASRGEPLICPDIEEMLVYTAGKFLALKLNTNAWFLDESKCHSILQSGVNTLVFSADAASEPAYSKLRVNGNLDHVYKNIKLSPMSQAEINDASYSDVTACGDGAVTSTVVLFTVQTNDSQSQGATSYGR